jgi:hypothetical protein
VNGIGRSNPKFIVHAGLVTNKRGTQVVGWYLKLKDGSGQTSTYSDKDFIPVVRQRKKHRKLAAPKGNKSKASIATPTEDAGIFLDVISREMESDSPPNGQQLAAFMSRAGRIVRDVLRRAGISEAQRTDGATLAIRQSGKEKINKIGAIQFEELLKSMEAKAKLTPLHLPQKTLPLFLRRKASRNHSAPAS